MSLMDNVLTAGALCSDNKKEVIQRAKVLFELVNIPEITQKKISTQVSGGEAQRAGIVRAVINRPSVVFACEDFGRVSNDLCYLGENPNEKDEIALGSVFEGKYNIGDRIEIQNGDISQSYEVTGFVQSVNYQGNVCEFSLEGYETLNLEPLVPALYVYLNNAADTEKNVEEIENNYSDKVVSIMNYQKMTETTQEMYLGITSIIVVVIFVLTILIVLFVLYIVKDPACSEKAGAWHLQGNRLLKQAAYGADDRQLFTIISCGSAVVIGAGTNIYTADKSVYFSDNRRYEK